MTDENTQGEAAVEAAQHVVDDVTSYEYGADKDRIEEQLDKGLNEAEVTVPDEEKQRLVEEIDAVKSDEDGGTPEVWSAQPNA